MDAAAPPTEPAPSAPPPQAARWRAVLLHRWIWLGVVVLAVGGGAAWYFLDFSQPSVGYATAVVTRGDVESRVVAAGIVQPLKYVDVGAQTSGKLLSLKVSRGDQVKKDQLLAEIDPILTETAIRSSTAALESMTAQRSLKQAQQALAVSVQARSDKAFAQGGGVSANDRDIAHANVDIAVADVAALTAQMKQATAAIDTATANLAYTKITAPMPGEVVSILALEGQTLNANQSAPNILRIADISTITVWAQVSEADIVRVKAGQTVYFTVLGDTRRWTGTVRQVLPTPELINNVVFYDVLFDIPNTEGILKIQMTAQVFIVLAQAKAVLLMPSGVAGNTADGGAMKIRVINAAGAAESRSIKIGIKGEIMTEVTEGLQEGERVVVRENTAASPGLSVSALTARPVR